jgi:uncharacterized protein (DUF4213/DUF364 family)
VGYPFNVDFEAGLCNHLPDAIPDCCGGHALWEIYDELIAAMPDDLTVSECMIGMFWTIVRSRSSGLAMTPSEGKIDTPLAGHIAGMRVRDLAQYIKSWNPLEATLGLAAINSYLNAPGQVEALTSAPLSAQAKTSVFETLRETVKGKKVAVIGHFPDLEKLSNVCELSILERRPGIGDYPDPACEYLIPEQDYVFMTATTLINKTLPRLLELSRKARTIMVGPSTPLTPILFRHGVDVLAGTVVIDDARLRQVVQEGAHRTIFERGGQMVELSRTD